MVDETCIEALIYSQMRAGLNVDMHLQDHLIRGNMMESVGMLTEHIMKGKM